MVNCEFSMLSIFVFFIGILMIALGLDSAHGTEFHTSNVLAILTGSSLILYAFYSICFDFQTKEALGSELLFDTKVTRFYRNSLQAWSSGKLQKLSDAYGEEVMNCQSYEDFVKIYPPYKESGLQILFEKFPPREKEFLIGLGDEGFFPAFFGMKGWFIITNLRLIQRNGEDDEFYQIELRDIERYECRVEGPVETIDDPPDLMVFYLKSGRVIEFRDFAYYPKEQYLDYLLSLEEPIWP